MIAIQQDTLRRDFRAFLHDESLRLGVAAEALMQDLWLYMSDATPQTYHPAIDFIQQAVSRESRIPLRLITAKTRRREVIEARQIAMYLCTQHTSQSLKTIGQAFGGRDHSTVIYARKSVQNKLATEEGFRRRVSGLSHKILAA